VSCSMRPTRGSEARWKNGRNTLEGEAHREADNGGDDGLESCGLTGGFRRRCGPKEKGGRGVVLCAWGQRKRSTGKKNSPVVTDAS
jgi:hypothetical protein